MPTLKPIFPPGMAKALGDLSSMIANSQRLAGGRILFLSSFRATVIIAKPIFLTFTKRGSLGSFFILANSVDAMVDTSELLTMSS